jgi:hypothetical protein
MENDAEIFPAHYTCKVAEKGFKMASMMNKLAMIIISCEIILEIFFCLKSCEIHVCNILVCALYPIKYGTTNKGLLTLAPDPEIMGSSPDAAQQEKKMLERGKDF